MKLKKNGGKLDFIYQMNNYISVHFSHSTPEFNIIGLFCALSWNSEKNKIRQLSLLFPVIQSKEQAITGP